VPDRIGTLAAGEGEGIRDTGTGQDRAGQERAGEGRKGKPFPSPSQSPSLSPSPPPSPGEHQASSFEHEP
jgi:hypothetical protein